MKKDGRKAPLLPERLAAWIAVFLLIAAGTVTLAGTLAVHVLTDAGLYARTAENEKLLDEQLSRIYASIDEFAEEYGFSAEAVKKAVSREELAQFGGKAAEWWSALLTEGRADAVPRWNPDGIAQAVSSTLDPENRRESPLTLAADLAEIVERTVFPIRGTLVTKGMDFVGTYADIPGILRAIRKLPLLGLAVCLLLAGVIVLLTGRDAVRGLKFIGTALGATGITVVSLLLTVIALGPGKILGEASGGLAGEFGTLAGGLAPAVWGTAALLIAAGYACLAVYRRKSGKRPGTAAEQGT